MPVLPVQVVHTKGSNPRSKRAVRREKRRTAARAASASRESKRRQLGRSSGDRWRRRSARVRAIRSMVRGSGKSSREITKADFKRAGLGHVLSYWYNGSVRDALADAGFGF